MLRSDFQRNLTKACVVDLFDTVSSSVSENSISLFWMLDVD